MPTSLRDHHFFKGEVTVYVNSKATLLLQAIQDLGAGGPYNAPKIALFTNDMNPGRNNVFADFVIADFGGLTNVKTVTWGTPYINGNLQAEVLAGLLDWLTVSSALLPMTAFGYVLLDTAGTDWLLAERFATPWIFNTGGPPLNLISRLVWNT
jgi:hypothetical protein